MMDAAERQHRYGTENRKHRRCGHSGRTVRAPRVDARTTLNDELEE